jgi:chromosome segregation ATPase
MSLTPIRGPIQSQRPRPIQAAAAPVRVQATAPSAPSPVKVPAKAGSPLLVEYYLYKAYQQSRENVAGFKASLELYAAALNEARVGAENAKQALAAAQAAVAKADQTAVVPFNAAKEAHAAAHLQHQAPVDTLSKQLRQAWGELDLAVHPGRPEAEAKNSEAGRVRTQLESLDDQIRDRYARLGSLSPHSTSYGSQATALRDEIGALEAQQRPLFKQYVALSDKADAAHAPQANPNDAQVQAAKAKVAKLEAALTGAQATYRQETDKTLLVVDREQQRYNRALGDFRSAVVGAERDLVAADELLKVVQTAYDKRKPSYNVFKRLTWKLFYGVDVNKDWDTERRQALGQPEPVKKK